MNPELPTSMINHLIEKVKAGDEKAFSRLVGMWHKRIYNFAYRFAGREEIAEEVVQQTFIQVFQKVSQLKDVASFKPWLYRIASNCCNNEGRKIKRQQRLQRERVETSWDDPDTPESLYRRKELNQLVLDVLGMIPEEQRTVIIMKEYEGLKFKEIADALGESQNTIKSRMYYGLDAMRKILSNRNLSKEIYYE